MGIIKAIYFLIRAFLTPRLMLAAENLALRQQVSVYKQSVKRPKLRLSLSIIPYSFAVKELRGLMPRRARE